MEKVMLSKEIADAINDVTTFYSPSEIIATIVMDRGCSAYGTKMNILVKMYHEGTLDIDKLMNALVNGFDIKKTAEDKLIEKYNTHKEIVEFYKNKGLDICEATHQEAYSRGYISGVNSMVKTFKIDLKL